MSQLKLSFFGAFPVTAGQKTITHFRSANNQGLLVYLALQSDRPFPRELLAALFWPEEPDRNARNNLRQALYQLRTLLGPKAFAVAWAQGKTLRSEDAVALVRGALTPADAGQR